MADYTLEILHAADQEAGIPALDDAPRFSAVLNALRNQDLGNDGLPDNTLVLSSGDAILPGLFFSASEEVYGGAGRADILIQNELGFQALAFGNHEFDLGTELLADLIGGALAEGFPGTAFPYLSANLDFSTDANLAGLVGPDAVAPAPNTIAASTVINVNGQNIGVVGATTPTIDVISSPGDVTIAPADFDGNPTPAQLDALAAEIQADVNALLAANPGLNKVVLLSHMQQLAIEQELASRLRNVDIIIGGGSNTRLLDGTDRLRDGDTAQGLYPIFTTDADGNPVAIVNTDGSYKYVGRLVIGFDNATGLIDPSTYDPTISGAYATDAQGVSDLGAEGLVDPEIQEIVNNLRAVIEEKESNVFGISTVYLDGTRGSVRTEETNLGNLTADANLAIAREITGDESILVSLKNGGGIRDDIGRVIVPPGGTGDPEELPNEAIPGVKPEGGISETDIANSLRFNNGLTVMDITREGLVAVLEHGVAASSLDDSNTQGRFPQVSGIEFSFDLTAESGNRIQSAAIKSETGQILDILVENGEFVGDPIATVRMVTLGFLAGDEGDPTGIGGDGYPFPAFASNYQDLAQEEDAPRTGNATFAPDGSEQDALAEYLFDNFLDTPFTEADTGRSQDNRLQNLAFRPDTVLIPGFTSSFDGPFTKIGSLELADGAEINAYDGASQRLFVVSGEPVLQVVDLSDPTLPVALPSIDLSAFGDGINSVAVYEGLLAVAVESGEAGVDGTVVFLNASDGTVLNAITVGDLPDMLTFTPDGTKVVVANEGEPNDDYSVDPEGSISIIDLSNGVENAVETNLGFRPFNDQKVQLQEQGVRLFGLNASVAQDLEPEYIAVAPDGTKAWVTLQENNAVAAVDLVTESIEGILPLGFKDFSQDAKLDASNEDGGINIRNWPVFGMYQPDSIDSYTVNGMTYYVTANEGDARIRPDGDLEDDQGNVILDEGAVFNEENRIGDDEIVLDPEVFPNAAELKLDENLGRLNITNTLGDTDGDGDFDELYSYGGRSFSIWDENGNLVYDSGDDIAKITAQLTPQLFNANDGDPDEFDNRSDDKGAEPEALTLAQVGGSTFAFIGLERAGGGVLIYDITDPTSPLFVQYVRDDADIAPEGVTFINKEDSPNGQHLLIVTNEESNTLAIYGADSLPDRSGTGSILDLTGFDGDVTVNATLEREAVFDNVLRFYETDVEGRVGGLLPGEEGYEDAVRENLIEVVDLFVSNLVTQTDNIVVAGGSYLAPALLVDGDINNLVTIADRFNGQSRIQRDGNTWRFEDFIDGDFNDFVFTINSAEPLA
jgi:2',3'-cyclic-nucleotide 2'-phosphodiesterase/3'-nucleotidase/5'-nucleotidase